MPMPFSHPSSNLSSSDRDSTRSIPSSSGRKSPDPFKRFRRLSSATSLNLSSSAHSDAHTSTQIDSSSPDQAPHKSLSHSLSTKSPPPPKPSSSSKPAFPRPKRSKSSSISILSTGLGLRARGDSSSDSEAKKTHRRSASLSASELETRASPDSPYADPGLLASESPAFSDPKQASADSPSGRSFLLPPLSSAQSKQHKQAWYQAQQKTIELEKPYNGSHAEADTDRLFPINVETTDSAADPLTASSSPSHPPQPKVETFLSEQEMLAAGIHVIRRRDDPLETLKLNSEIVTPLPTTSPPSTAPTPSLPPRLKGADHSDFLELIDSPIESTPSSPNLEQLIYPTISMRSTTSNTSGSAHASVSASPASSSEQLSASAKEEKRMAGGAFSFAKLRRATSKDPTSSRPSTAGSLEDPDRKGFPLSSSTLPPSSAPAYLTPAPSSSASPFLNMHSASVGRASGLAGAAQAKQGLAQVYFTKSATAQPSTSSTLLPPSSPPVNPNAPSPSLLPGPPPKPPRPKPSLLSAAPRAGNGQSVSAPNTAPMTTSADDRASFYSSSPGYAPAKDSMSSSQPSPGLYGPSSHSHSRSQENLLDTRLDAEALRASAGTPLPPPRRLKSGQPRPTAPSAYLQPPSNPMMRSASSGGGGVVGALGQVGQIGAAMGRRGWDFMKNFQGTSSSNSNSQSAPRNQAAPSRMDGFGLRTRSRNNSSVSNAIENEATRRWLSFLEEPEPYKAPGRAAGTSDRVVFGAPLKEAVLLSRLAGIRARNPDRDRAPDRERKDSDHLGIPDLGRDFSINFLDSPRTTPRASLAGPDVPPLSREEARHLLLPRVIVRCIESLERWGLSEEGIYRISGRSSHTTKLRTFFSDPRRDLKLQEISPADLDINSVCSVLKGYLRELPEPLIPAGLAGTFDRAVSKLFAAQAANSVNVTTSTLKDGRTADMKASQIDPTDVEREFVPLMRQLPIYNWYLLRELAQHLGQLSQAEVVAQTKMPLSNLTLVLAPTLSISLPMLQLLVQQRNAVFKGPAPVEDGVGMDAVLAPETTPALAQEERSEKQDLATPSAAIASSSPFGQRKPEKPPKPLKFSSPSRLPIMVRKRASSMGLGAFLPPEKAPTAAAPSSSPSATSATASNSSTKGNVKPNLKAAQESHRKTPSLTPEIDAPLFSSDSAKLDIELGPSSPSMPDEPYQRPSTSLGHFADSSTDRNLWSTRNRGLGSRGEALRYNALALDDDLALGLDGRPRLAQGRGGPATGAGAADTTPIARYYARIREEAEKVGATDSTKDERSATPLALPSTPQTVSDAFVASTGGGSGAMHQYWADKVAASGRGGLEGLSGGRSGATSALDRPRPPTSNSASFFAGRSRRQDSVNGLNAFKSPTLGAHPKIGRSRESSCEDPDSATNGVGLGIGSESENGNRFRNQDDKRNPVLGSSSSLGSGIPQYAARTATSLSSSTSFPPSPLALNQPGRKPGSGDTKPLKIVKRTPPNSAGADGPSGRYGGFSVRSIDKRANVSPTASSSASTVQSLQSSPAVTYESASTAFTSDPQIGSGSAESTPKVRQLGQMGDFSLRQSRPNVRGDSAEGKDADQMAEMGLEVEGETVADEIERYLDSGMDFEMRRKMFESPTNPGKKGSTRRESAEH